MSERDPQKNTPTTLEELSDEQLGLAGRTAKFFIDSPLSLLFYVSMTLMGVMGLMLTPRQEDPQISVPMIDIFVQYSGAEVEQVVNLAIEPLERIMSEIPGVKHVYSASERGRGIVTIEFDVGEEMEPSLVKVNDKLDSNMDLIPPGVSPPLVKAKGIDDVPVVNLTLWSKDLDRDGIPDVDDGQLRMLAHDVLQNLKELPKTGGGFVVGGRAERVTVEVFPERLSGYQISLDQVANTIQTANAEQRAGGVEAGDTHFTVVTGSFLKTADDINNLMVGIHHNVPVYVHDVARVLQGPEDATQLVAYYTGAASDLDVVAEGIPAVTIAIAKKKGSNGVDVANAVIDRMHDLKGKLIPANVEVSITRDYGKTANDKVNELIFKLFVATGFVFILVLVAFRAIKPAVVVVLVIPVVLLFTIFCAWLMGYTIDRVSLFALIFSIGILVDDAIVVVENIYRRWLEAGTRDAAVAVDAVREVGNPTILATFTVVAALLPMGFVSGMMGPYMEPIPALGSVAMMISLFAAFVFTPWLSISRWLRPSMKYLQVAEEREHKESEKLEGLFRRVLEPLIQHRGKRLLFRATLWGAFFFACSMFYFNWVVVKMLPLDNKPEFSVVLDMPEGTALPVTANLAHQIAVTLRELPEVTALQLYAGTARPFDFNGMVRHYYMRQEPWQGEVQVQLLDKTDRKRSSHEIAVEARRLVEEITEGTGATTTVVEMPPGPPVLQSVVAEVHGPSPEVRRQVARDLTQIFSETESLRDVDNYLRGYYEYWRFVVDTEKAVRRGISVDTINRNLSMALGGMRLGDVKQRAGHEPVNIIIQVPLAARSEVTRLSDLPVQSRRGGTVPLQELGRFEKVPQEDIIYHKDLRDVEYVVADVGGRLAAPVYGMFQVEDRLADYTAPDGVKVDTFWLGPPENDNTSAIEWAGEWTVTFETFRDMGAAFMVALVLIYILVVWEFGNFRIPALIMAPIPLTLLGIIPMHAAIGAEFTATSMIGWIALAGIIVRNSILLVDFSVHEVQHGTPVAEAVIRSCKTRTRPILITALALVAGSSVIFFDPIFQGMAVSLAAGVMVSTILTLIVIPLGCISASKALCEVAAANCPPGTSIPMPEDAHRPVSPQPQPVKVKTPILLTLWGKFITAVMMVFYALRGIVILVVHLLKKLLPSRKSRATPLTPRPGGTPSGGGSTPPPPAGPGPAGAGGSGGASNTGGAAAKASQPAAPVQTKASSPSLVPSEAKSVKVSVAESAGGSEAGSRKDEVERTKPRKETVKVVSPKEAILNRPAKAAKASSGTGARASDSPSEQSEATPTASRKSILVAEGGAEPEAGGKIPSKTGAGNKALNKSKQAKPQKSEGGSKISKAAVANKKSSRRGIRLKADADSFDGGL